MDDTWVRIDVELLRQFAATLMERAGLTPDNAARVADVLVYADTRGLPSHGVGRLPIYVRRLAIGTVNARPEIRVSRENGGVSILDADNGPGPVAASIGMKKALALGQTYGVGACVVRNSNHCGALGYYTSMAVPSRMIGIGATNANATVIPWGGREAALGTNPLSIAIPTPEGSSFVLDMSTSAVARGKILLAAKRGLHVPEGWAIDRSGKPTQDAGAALNGALVPMAGPKGYGLALAIDVLSGVLGNSAFGRRIGALNEELDRPQRVGHFFMALGIRSFMDADAFLGLMREMISELRTTPLSDGHEEILLPGEPEAREQREACESGARVPAAIWDELRVLAAQLGVEVPSTH